MSDIKILNEMIKDTAKVALVDTYGKKHVKLDEPQRKDSSVTINGMPGNAIVIKADLFKSPDAVFKGSQGECKRADFVIVADAGKSKKVILCIELKAGKRKSNEEIIQQLKGAECFVRYCRELGHSFWNQQDFLKDYVYRFISITNISISKTNTRTEFLKEPPDRPEKMMKISSSNELLFNHIAWLTGSK